MWCKEMPSKVSFEKLLELERYGLSISDLFMRYLPKDLASARTMLINCFSKIVNQEPQASIETFLSHYRSILKSEELCRYLVLVGCLNVSRDVSVKIPAIYEVIRHVYENEGLNKVIESMKVKRDQAQRIAEIFIQTYHEHTKGYSYPLDANEVRTIILRFVNYINNLYRLRNYDLLEHFGRYRSVRSLSRDIHGMLSKIVRFARVTRASKLLVKWLIHPVITTPIAIEICRKELFKQYQPHIDRFTAMVVLKSGLFKLARSTKVQELSQMMSKGRRVKIRLEKYDDIIQIVLHLGSDPLALENALFHIGYEFCRKGNCKSCPINSWCEKNEVILK